MNLNRILFAAIIFFIFSMVITVPSYAIPMTAPVSGFARNFTNNEPISDAKVTILENGQNVSLNSKGEFGPIQWPVGKPITFVIEKLGYRTTQTATVIVPPEGLTTPYNNVSLQPIDVFTFGMFALAMGVLLDENKCHVGAAVTAFHKTLNDLPQGEENATVTLIPNPTSAVPYYVDIFRDGSLKNYPNPMTHGLTQTSQDGGVIFANLEPRDEPYVLMAYKPNVSFTQMSFICRKGMFINASPPLGPMVLVVRHQ